MRWAEFMGYRIYTRHMVMVVLVVLLIITNVFDEVAVRMWDFTWKERKIIETAFVILGAAAICPFLYRRYFTREDSTDNA